MFSGNMMCSNSNVIFESYENQIVYDCHNSLGFGCGKCWDMFAMYLFDKESCQYNHIDWEQFRNMMLSMKSVCNHFLAIWRDPTFPKRRFRNPRSPPALSVNRCSMCLTTLCYLRTLWSHYSMLENGHGSCVKFSSEICDGCGWSCSFVLFYFGELDTLKSCHMFWKIAKGFWHRWEWALPAKRKSSR